MSKRLFVPIIVLVSIVAGFGGGLFYSGKLGQVVPSIGSLVGQSTNQPSDVNFSEFWDVWNLLQDNYVDKTKLEDKKNLLYGAIEGMVNSVGDPYTVFLRPKESKAFMQQISGSFGGIGIEIGQRDGVITVIAPIKDTPAAKAGLMAGDKIIKIGDKSTQGMNIDEAVSLIKGPKGTPVKLTYLRNGAKEGVEVTIIRDTIKIPSVDWKLVDGHTAYVQMFIFNKNLDDDFDKIAKEIKKSSADRIVLDLRNNPGGLLDSAVNIASYFMDSDKVVTVEKFGDGKENTFKTTANGMLKNYPLVVILNKGSASASEILAGSLKDNRGVTIVGETSFGKGSVQEVRDLPEGASLKITIAKWYTPKGDSISEHGIKPDVEVKLTEEDVKAEVDTQLDKAKELINKL